MDISTEAKVKTAKTTEEKIAILDKRLEQIRAQKKALIAKEKIAERKARTKRLIEIGAAVESVVGFPILKDDLPKLINFLKQQEQRGCFLTNALKNKQE